MTSLKIKVENLHKSFDKKKVLDGVNLEVQDKESLVILGGSGSGKSVLIKSIISLLSIDSGKIFIDGNDITKMNSDTLAIFRRRQIGIVYQFYNLIPILTVEENITLPCDLDKNPVDKKQLDEILDTFGLRARRKHLPNELSGGQQQRTSIARALIANPALVLADEPTGNLDTKASEDIMNLLKISNRTYNQTIIMITHDLELAKQADRIITISDGKIVEEG